MFLYHGPLTARTTHPSLGCHVHIASHPHPYPPAHIGTDAESLPRLRTSARTRILLFSSTHEMNTPIAKQEI
jgi:hypothetical protein